MTSNILVIEYTYYNIEKSIPSHCLKELENNLIGTEYFFVPIQEIKENGYDLSISRYKEIEYEEIQYEKPEVIIQKIEILENEIQKSLNDLKALLK